MNKKEIEELIRFVSKAGVSEVSLETKEIKITIKNVSNSPVPAIAAPVAVVPVTPVAVPASAPSKAEAPAKKEAAPDESHLQEIKSPMIGTFYRARKEGADNLVNVGDEIKSGQVVGIIEAMKIFNDIESDISGKIVKVFVDNGKPVDYDTPLFLVERHE